MKTNSSHIKDIRLAILVALFAFVAKAQEVNWISFSEAVALTASEENPKKVFIDVYTDWCGWCKKMDKDTFQNPEVAQYMQDNFYMVKMDGEGKEDIAFKGKTYKFIASGRKGYHELAAALMQGRLSYPTTIFLDEEMNMLSPVPGYQQPDPFLNIAKYFGSNAYKDKDWKTYAAGSK